jgi:hypothetical protein
MPANTPSHGFLANIPTGPQIIELPALTPPAVARRFGCGVGKVLGWIARRELVAINIASRPGMRPRWVIRLADLVAFERQRANTAIADSMPRRRRMAKAKRAADCFDFF